MSARRELVLKRRSKATLLHMLRLSHRTAIRPSHSSRFIRLQFDRSLKRTRNRTRTDSLFIHSLQRPQRIGLSVLILHQRWWLSLKAIRSTNVVRRRDGFGIVVRRRGHIPGRIARNGDTGWSGGGEGSFRPRKDGGALGVGGGIAGRGRLVVVVCWYGGVEA